MNTQLVCPKCGVFNDVEDSKCWKCKRPITEEDKQSALNRAAQAAAEKQQYDNLSQAEKDHLLINKARNNGDWSIIPEDVLKRATDKIILTTSFQLAAHEISNEVAVISAEVVYGMNIFRDLFAGIRDIVGGRSVAVQKVLRNSRDTVLYELKKEALMVDAEAVIAIDLDYQEISGGEKNGMIMLVASGTAVNISK